jgi:hypothetical protein
MKVAIETSTIVASVMRALTNADLVFFNDKYIKPKFVPESVEQVCVVVNVLMIVRAHRLLSWPLPQTLLARHVTPVHSGHTMQSDRLSKRSSFAPTKRRINTTSWVTSFTGDLWPMRNFSR